ncbi:MAG: serine/threonine-protein kinase [Phycisphaerae bacterium]|nr:serine/threonine-protein kinase [Phycisphaerae bacterium]
MKDFGRPMTTTDAPDSDAHLLGESLPDDSWLERLRRAVRPVPLGRLGRYELLEQVAQGAQGIVYRAVDSRTGRIVALKRLRAGQFATPLQQRRFERELEATIDLQHSGIVAIREYDVIDGQPILAMEWVTGQPIDRWAWRGDRISRQPLPEILRVFHDVCAAVQHAHQRGVIHRDLKPGNILVDFDGRPHVLDFGLALRTLDSQAASRFTATSEFVGTPAYAAPEQVRGDRESIDVRTDVYALGILLYEMLSGRAPFAEEQNLAALFDAIREDDPAPPSHRNGDVHPDLDAIVLKAISKDRARRYQSVDALSADLKRHQSGEPIEARRSQPGYALRVMLRRHRGLLAIAGVTIVVLAAWVLTLSRMYARQTQMLAQVSDARQESERAQATLERLLLSVAEFGRGADLELRRYVLAEAQRSADEELRDNPAAWATAQDAIGRTYQRLALYDDAERCVRAALEQRIALHGREHADVATGLTHLGEILRDRARGAEAEPLFREALAIRQRLLGPDHPEVAESLYHIGIVLQSRGEHQAAAQTHRTSLDMQMRLLGPSHPSIAQSYTGLGYAHFNLREFAIAEDCFRRALAMRIQLHDEDHRDVAGARIDLGKTCFERGRLDEAETLIRAALATFRRLFGSRHDNTAWAAHRLGVVMTATGRFDEADTLLHESLETYRVTLGSENIYTAFVEESLAELALRQGRTDEAVAHLRESERILRTLPHQDDVLRRVRARLAELGGS